MSSGILRRAHHGVSEFYDKGGIGIYLSEASAALKYAVESTEACPRESHITQAIAEVKGAIAKGRMD